MMEMRLPIVNWFSLLIRSFGRHFCIRLYKHIYAKMIASEHKETRVSMMLEIRVNSVEIIIVGPLCTAVLRRSSECKGKFL